jgi:hypothetical protein
MFVLEKWFIGLPRHFNNLTDDQDEILESILFEANKDSPCPHSSCNYTLISHIEASSSYPG